MFAALVLVAFAQVPTPQASGQSVVLMPPTKSAPPVLMPPTKSAPPVLMPPAKGTPQGTYYGSAQTTYYGSAQGGVYTSQGCPPTVGYGNYGAGQDNYNYKSTYTESKHPKKGFHPLKKIFHGGA